MPLTAGTRLGPYEILAAIGAGGMGQVYRARDTRLDRTVAIKVLHESYGADPERRERFEREAKLVASLDHPHICALHDVGRERDIDYLVMPYFEGGTLAERLKAGPLPVAQALEVAAQIADALDRAHRHGIVHRDLKPGNVMLTKTGVRLLDFGLAFTDDPPRADSADVATRSALTQMGAMLGTLPYMAPEQLAGQRPDARADIWAFGCVLYEMLYGRRPFTGDSDAALVSAIMTAAPPPAGATPPVSGAIDAVLSGALVKDREERWQHMRDVRRALAMAGAVADSQAAVARPARSRSVIGAIGALGAATIVIAWLAWRVLHGAPPAQAFRFDVDPVGNSVIATTTDTNPYFAVSPDGAQIAFVAADKGHVSIWIKRLDGDAPEELADTSGGASPFWSPDSRSIGFFAGGALKRKALDNSPAQTLCKVDGVGFNGAWSPAGIIIVNEWGSHRLMRVPEAGGAPALVLTGQVSYGYPSFLPDGRHFLFVVPDLTNAAAHTYVGSLDGGDTVVVAGVSSRAEYVNDGLVYWRDGSLVAQPFDLKTFQVSGQPGVIASGLRAFSITGFAALSTSPRTLVYQAGAITRQLVWADRQGLESAPIEGGIEGGAEYVSLRLSPDGSRVALSARDPRLGTNDVFIHEITRKLTRHLTSEPGTENNPVWTPDGTSVVYAADRHGPPNLHMRSIDGSQPEIELLPPSNAGPQSPGMFTKDGATLVYVGVNDKTGYDIMSMAVDHHSPPVAIVATKGRDSSPRLTADDRWLAFATNESGRYEVYVQPLNDPRGRRQVSRDGGVEPRWRGDGTELYFVAGADRTQMMAVDLKPAGSAIEPGVPHLLFVGHARIYDFDVTKDGRQFLLISIDSVAERGTLSAWVNWAK